MLTMALEPAGRGTSKRPGTDQEASSSEDAISDVDLQYTEAEATLYHRLAI